MSILLLSIVIAIVLALVFDKLQSYFVARSPNLKRPIAQISRLGKAAFLVCSIFGATWVIAQSPSQTIPLPAEVHPPALDPFKWTVYDEDKEDNSESSLALPATIDEDGNAEVWNRFDDKETGETTLTLTKYDCEQETLSEFVNVYFKNGSYDGYEDLDATEKIKVELGAPDGVGYLLACHGIKPSSI